MQNIQPTCIFRVKGVGTIKSCTPVAQLIVCAFLCLCFTACAPDASLLGGGSWQASTLTTQRIVALTVNPTSPQTLYAGNGDGTIFKSTDAGLQWTQLGSISLSTSQKLLTLVINPTSKVIYALTDNGLFASTNSAQTWQLVNTDKSGLPNDSYTTMTFNGQNATFVGTLHHGVLQSNDAGTHWQAMNGTLPAETAISDLAFDSTQHRLWAATSLGVYRSDNNGQTWNAFNEGLPVADGVSNIQLAASFGGASGLVYAGTLHGIYRSTDSGAHWNESGQVLRNVPIERILIDYRSTNASTLYAGTRFGVFRSDDEGQNWSGVAAGFPKNTSVDALVIGGEKASQLYVAANNVYLYPGTSNGLNPTRIVTLLLVLVFFGLLVMIAQRSRRRRSALLRPKSSSEISTTTKT